MSARQAYWQNLRIIHSATGSWHRRMSFAAAHEWVSAYEDDIQAGHDQRSASNRAYDYLVYNRNHTMVSRSELAWTR